MCPEMLLYMKDFVVQRTDVWANGMSDIEEHDIRAILMEILVNQLCRTSLIAEEWQGTQRKRQCLSLWRRAEKNMYHFPQMSRWCLTLWRDGLNFKRVSWCWCYTDGLFRSAVLVFIHVIICHKSKSNIDCCVRHGQFGVCRIFYVSESNPLHSPILNLFG